MRIVQCTCVILVLALLAVSGCDRTNVSPPRKRPVGPTGPEFVREAVIPISHGNITGKVSYDGAPPARIKQERGASDTSCHANAPNDDENFDQTWIVRDGGVKNVVVFLQPPRDKFFQIPEEQRKPADIVIVRQPRCAFIDHVFVLFPSYYDPNDKENEGQRRTGQKLVIKNDAPFDHNYVLTPQSHQNRQYDSTLKPGTENVIATLNPQTKPMVLRCNLHNWMNACAFALEHPYAAVTKDDGTFEIKNAPLGVPLQVVAWHEGAAFFNGGEDGTTMTFQANQVLDLPKIKKR